MEPVSLSWIAEVSRGKLLSGDPSTTILGISTDTRTISKGELFVALKGERFDGHDFIDEVFGKGASGVVLQRPPKKLIGKGVIEVEDTLRALGDIAGAYRRRFNPRILAISGSNGKTTTKEMVAHLLKMRFNTIKARASFNNFIGVPLTLLEITNITKMVVLEMETNLLGGIRRLCEIAEPSIGILTNISDTHLESLKTRDGVFMEKKELVDSLQGNGVAVLNKDDPYLGRIKREGLVTYGIRERADFQASSIETKDLSINFLLNNRYRVQLKTFFYCNVYNALAAIASSHLLGLSIDEAVEGLARFRFLPMRMELISTKDFKIINDAYNANPKSMKEAISTLKGKGRRRVAILGDMLELGEPATSLHYDIGKFCFHCGLDVLVLIGEYASWVSKGAMDSGMEGRNIFVYSTNKEALRDIPQIIKKGDVILVKGSRKMRLEEIVDFMREISL
jgi:UDP-N-acetylmuramoyl-tripeptide--D-alanyl-D-alanine ligase